MSAHDYEFTSIDGKPLKLNQFVGKPVLVVNTASECGLTPQYKGLQDLSKKYGDKLVVLGVPSNDFGGQEPGTEAEIKEFCSTEYQVTFPMMDKLHVKGPEQHPLYKELTGPGSAFPGDVKWNFGKFLIGPDGAVVAGPVASLGGATKLAPGTTVGAWRVTREIGSGGMAVVYRGFDPAIRRPAALKLIRKADLDPREAQAILARFKREAQAAGALHHPHVVAIYEYGEDDECAWIAMELVDGVNPGEEVTPEQRADAARRATEARACRAQAKDDLRKKREELRAEVVGREQGLVPLAEERRGDEEGCDSGEEAHQKTLLVGLRPPDGRPHRHDTKRMAPDTGPSPQFPRRAASLR